MPITCNAILTVPKFKNVLTLLAGEKGLEHPIRWTHFLESENEAEFLQGSELVFTTGIAFQNNPQKLSALIRALGKYHAAGLVINIGEYLENIPDEIINCANELEIPLISVQWKYRLVDITRLIGRMIVEDGFRSKSISHLLENILFSTGGDFAEYASTAEYYGYTVNTPLQIAVFDFPNLKNYLLTHHTAVTKEEFQIAVYGIADGVMQRTGKKYLYLWRNYNLIMALPVNQEDELSQTKSNFEEIKSAICHRMPTLVTHIGLGSQYDSLEKLRFSYREANFAIRLCDNNPHSGFVLYRTAGIYKLLNKIHNPKILKEFYNEVLEPLLKYDQKNNTDFTKTLETYFNEGENSAAVSGILYIHRNTLKYRLRRIEEILGYPVNDPEEKINLQIAFKIKKYLALLGEKNAI